MIKVEEKKVNFNGEELVPVIGEYQNGQTSIELLDKDGMTYMTASVSIEHEMVEVGKDDVIIKNYSENQGILQALYYAGIIEEPHRAFTYNYVTLYICKIN